MNKTIIININGSIFHIEEDAYEVLKTYMTDIKRHFAYSKDSFEIVTDIENRLAEMFNERLAEHKKQVIVTLDVEEILALMGSVEDFGVEEEQTYSGIPKSQRKFFRDIDEKVIGGVCAGFAHYADLDIKLVRILTAVITLFTGIGFPLYIILWIVLPPALSRQDRMAMKGEPINLSTFKKNFDDEVESIRQNFKRSGTGDTIGNIFSFIGKFISAIVKMIGSFFILFGSVLLISLIATLFFAISISNEQYAPFPLNTINPEYSSGIFFGAFLLLTIPLVALILFAIKVIFSKSVVSRTGAFGMLILWLTGLGMSIFYGTRMFTEFKEEARFEQETTLPEHSTLYLKLNPIKNLSLDDSIKLKLNERSFRGRILKIDNNDEFDHLTRFYLEIEKSNDGKASLVKEFYGRGNDFGAALKAAERSRYNFLISDSLVTFDKNLTLEGKGPYRAQEVLVKLKVPANTRLKIEGDMNVHIKNMNLWDCTPEHAPDNYLSEWIMTDEGLKCANDSLARKKDQEEQN